MMYKDLIENKRVIFVGGCSNLINKEQGEWIDSFDIVIRSNGFIELLLNKGLHKDYGKRIDVLYTNVQFAREMRPFPIRRYVGQGVKYLCMKGKTGLDFLCYSYSQYLKVRTFDHAMKTVQQKVKSATTGIALFQDIANQNPKEFWITGIDFFVSKKKEFEHNNYKEYLTNYLPDKIREQGNKINIGKTEDGHDFYENAKYIYEELFNRNRVAFPDFIRDLLISIVEGRRVQL